MKEVKNIMRLPCPRLELRWVKIGKTWDKRECIYEIVIPLQENDIRCEDADGKKVRCVIRAELGRTKVEGGIQDGESPAREGFVDTPFRDGCHAQWDAAVMNLPVFATCGKKYSQIKY